MNFIKKLNSLNFIALIVTIQTNIITARQVTCTFKNSTEIPVTFKSFADLGSQPTEIKNINSGESFTSNLQAEKSVAYDMQPNVDPYYPSFTPIGAFNIYYNKYQNKFSYERGSFTNEDPETQNAIVSSFQITNRTIFPIKFSIFLKDAGQGTQYLHEPPQAIHRTKLPINGFYALTDAVDRIIIYPAINGYHSKALPLYSIKNRCDIINNNGNITIQMNN